MCLQKDIKVSIQPRAWKSPLGHRNFRRDIIGEKSISPFFLVEWRSLPEKIPNLVEWGSLATAT